jgi:anaerobic C4-dicarboxylate transporter
MIPKENLIKIIEDNKLKTENSTYKLLDVLCCNFDIMPSHIQTFSSSDENVIDKKKILKSISSINDVIIQPSTFIFHDINSIYIIFREHELDKNTHRYKSILKKPNTNQKHKHTKKVRINLTDPTIKNNKKRITRKTYIDIKDNK